ncbi:MAG: UTP--glucose-1-phosphate uridylyltransferase [Bifidobacteriaceae bacterium]|jgi:UTP--glucose-1-phosphate uridylyltransferase|nr:UTP--glucose-1-phosphate uridylyltransferase [Bifidobacteriaceae bacterium]
MNPVLSSSINKMRNAEVDPINIKAFERLFSIFESGDLGIISERDVESVTNIVEANALGSSIEFKIPNSKSLGAQSSVSSSDNFNSESDFRSSPMTKTVVIKLNGGLGTSMGLTRAKTLLEIAPNVNFLDVIAQQVLQLRDDFQTGLPLIFMNSYSTSTDTMNYLAKYPELRQADLPLEFLQSKEPKLSIDSHLPVEFPANPQLEWCPPGHGDLYPTLYATGLLNQLVELGYEVAFISNADNLAAVVEPQIAEYFYENQFAFMNELTPKTAKDVKGGHLVRRKSDGRLLLREFSQIAEVDIESALSSDIHPYCNTNNIWVNLLKLQAVLQENQGILSLPLIRNQKTVDPTDPKSEAVIQLETAMGAACSCFDNATAIGVGRDRFQPVKNQVDLDDLQHNAHSILENIRSRVKL